MEFERFFALRFPMLYFREALGEALGARDKGMSRSRSRAFGTLLGFGILWSMFHATGILSRIS